MNNIFAVEEMPYINNIKQDNKNLSNWEEYAKFLKQKSNLSKYDYINSIIQIFKNPDDIDTITKFHKSRVNVEKWWLHEMEQPSLFYKYPLSINYKWWASGIFDDEEIYTYKSLGYNSLCDLNTKKLIDFNWLEHQPNTNTDADVDNWILDIESLVYDIKSKGFPIPHNLINLLSKYVPYKNVIESCTSCYFTSYSEFKPVLVSSLDSLLITFYNDQQSCVTWGLLLHKSGSSIVVCFTLDEEFDANDTEYLYNSDEPVNIYDSFATNITFTSPSLETFIYRTWLENEIWYVHHPDYDDEHRNFTDEMKNYLNHYKK